MNPDADSRSLSERIESLDRLTDAKFVTHRAMLEAQAEKVALALAAAEKAIEKAEIAVEKRFDAINEFRKTINDQSATFATKPELAAANNLIERNREALDQVAKSTLSREVYDDRHAILEDRVSRIERSNARTLGIAAGMATAVTLGATIIFVLIRFATGH